MSTASRLAELRALLVTVAAGAGAGLVAVLTYQAMLALQRLVWTTGADGEDVGPWRIAITILIGGALLILLGRFGRSESVDELLAAAESPRSEASRQIIVTALVAIVAIAFGGSVGPEAGLLAVVAQCAAIVSRVIARTEARAREISRAGVAGALSGFYGAPPAAVAIDGDQLPASRLMSFIAGIAGFFVFLSVSRSVFGNSGVPELPLPAGTDGADWMLIVPALIACGFGLAFRVLHYHAERLAARIATPWQVTAIGTVAFAAVAVAFPLVRFSGHHELTLLPEMFGDGDASEIWTVAIAKVVALVLCLTAGWRGGEAFPLIFIGGLVGAGTALALPGLDPAAAVVAAMAAALAVGWRRPLASLLVLVLVLDTGYALALLIGVGLGAIVDRATTMDDRPDDASVADSRTGAPS
ncbi:chloride channel protein [Gordonia phthalatica]|uniref:Chloride channel protein n=1 Tax=Gordonia phthalatica TaxID=1136941 RepID=A0A0N9NAW5_9ACTN|nr:chloride channel protein [Gordonia phthalatica]ALG84157.1 hypothetical protein ACH46_06100 [Gordonia phthalatica]